MNKSIKTAVLVWAALLCACAAPADHTGVKPVYLKKYTAPGAYAPDYRLADKTVEKYRKQGLTLHFELTEEDLASLCPSCTPAQDAPLIGVLFNREKDAYSIPATYVYALLKSGARVRILSFEDIESQLEGIDGIVLTGGDFAWPPDMYFALEDKPYPPASGRYAAYEFLAGYASARRMPLLGICAGMQAMSYVLSNHQVKLHEDLKAVTSVGHRSVPATEIAHSITIEPESRLARILGAGETGVNSRHFQGVADSTVQACAGVRATAYSPDGVAEALEFAGYPNAIAVQFHPEVMAWTGNKDGQVIFDAFVQDAQAYKKRAEP